MRRYDDPVEVRRGMVAGPGDGRDEGPEQFLWRGRLWKVATVLAHWVETGPWWQSGGVHAVLGHEQGREQGRELDHEQGHEQGADGAGRSGAVALAPDLLAEREVWRVEAARGLGWAGNVEDSGGVFDLVLDWADGSWRLTRCVD